MHWLYLVISLRPYLPMLEMTKSDSILGLIPYSKDPSLQSFMAHSLMPLHYDKVPNGEHVAEHFIRIFEWARKRSTMATCSMEGINFCKICWTNLKISWIIYDSEYSFSRWRLNFEWFKHWKCSNAASGMLSIAYGLKAKSDTDKLIELVEKGAEPVNSVTVPGAYLVVRTLTLLIFICSARSLLTHRI
jgi:hypothetical protein